MAVVFLFAGQGSQYYHMGKELYRKSKIFRMTMEELDDLAIKFTGTSIVEEIYNPTKMLSDCFDRILYTHPAIFMLQYSLANILIQNNIKPDIVLGTSLGEFTAAVVAGVLSVEDALEAVIKQAEYFEEYCEAGAMLAIVNDISIIDRLPIITKFSEIVGINYNKHFVVSGTEANISYIQRYLKQQNIICELLPISFACHSKYIDNAAAPYIHFLNEKKMKRPCISFFSARYGKEIDNLPVDYFWQIARKPILFREALKIVEEKKDAMNCYFDLGPSNTLANFTKYNLSTEKQVQIHSIISPYNNNLKELETIILSSLAG